MVPQVALAYSVSWSAVDVRTPQLGGQQMAPAENVERQVAIAVVIAVEEPTLLLPCSGSSVNQDQG